MSIYHEGLCAKWHLLFMSILLYIVHGKYTWAFLFSFSWIMVFCLGWENYHVNIQASSERQMLSFPSLISGRTSAASSPSLSWVWEKLLINHFCYDAIRLHLVKAHILPKKVYLHPRTVEHRCLKHMACLQDYEYSCPANASEEVCMYLPGKQKPTSWTLLETPPVCLVLFCLFIPSFKVMKTKSISL